MGGTAETSLTIRSYKPIVSMLKMSIKPSTLSQRQSGLNFNRNKKTGNLSSINQQIKGFISFKYLKISVLTTKVIRLILRRASRRLWTQTAESDQVCSKKNIERRNRRDILNRSM